VVEDKPYKQKNLNNGIIERTFSKDVLSEELVWHRDRKDRHVIVVSGEGWLLQIDNQLPTELKEGHTYHIPAYVYHRIKRGNTDLTVQIRET
jgi:mannose-6-phosphate isomerase-like protein (cupin superfamily)